MFLTRREALKKLLLGTACIPLSRVINPSFVMAEGAGSQGRNLILVELSGGIDPWWSTPYRSSPALVNYIQSVRPALFVDPGTVVPLTAGDVIGLNPSWQSLITEAGNTMRLIQGIGITEFANGSHDFCQKVYSYGDPYFQSGLSKGWFARTIEEFNLIDHQAFAFGAQMKPDFKTTLLSEMPVVAQGLQGLTFLDPPVPLGGVNQGKLNQSYAKQFLQAGTPQTAAQQEIKDALLHNHDIHAETTQILSTTTLTGTYANAPIGVAARSVATLAKHYSGDSKNRLFYLSTGGFDTHANQLGGQNLAGKVTDVAQSLAGLIRDLKSVPGLYQRSYIVVFSEFGRRVDANGTDLLLAGSDHGHGSTFMALGGLVQKGVAGDTPSLAQIQSDLMLPATTAFQNLFVTGLQFLGYNPALIFPPQSYVSRNLGIF